jgi:hypothetical protein
MKTTITILTFLLTLGFGALLNSQAGQKGDPMTETDLNTLPSSNAFQTLDGKLLKIDGEYYVIKEFDGNEKRLHVSKETVMLSGPKKPGDPVRAEITKSGHAISIQ